MQNKNILITGGLGFIFSHVAEYFSKQNHVTVIDNSSDGSHPELIPQWNNIKTIQDDIINIGKYTQKYDLIIHAAAESNVDKAIVDQANFIQTNIVGTHAVLEYARNHCNQFLYINTDEVYGSSEEWSTAEAKLNPSNPYSASKAAGGHLCWAYRNTYGLTIQEVRMCNIIGQRQANTKLLPRIIERIKNNQEMPLYDGGTQTREYMDVRDVGPLLEKVLDYKSQEIYNLTFNQEISTIEMIQYVEKQTKSKAIITESSRPGHDRHYRMQPHNILYNEISQKLFHYNINDTIRWMLLGT